MSQMIDRTLAQAARAWPFEEARKVVARVGDKTPAKVPEKGYVLFETGYGPSGLPHIGTFGEVVRTTMVRQAFKRLSDVPTKLYCFSDDMDGLRKVPDNVPNKEMLASHLGKPLTSVPDPFSSEHPSFGAANNARLRAFLDSFGFEYEFQSATDWYKSGRFDKMLLTMLQHYDEVQAVMLPTLGEERRATYSIFLPISPKTGRVLQVPLVKLDRDAGTIVYRDDAGDRRQRQAAVEGRLGRPLVRPRRRLRDVRQGSHPLGRAFGQDREDPGRPAAGGLQLRALPRRGGPQDLQVQGQRPLGRGLAALRPARVACLVYAAAAQAGEAALLRRHPARHRRLSLGGRKAADRGAGQGAGEPGVAHPQR
jgi:hypothetical protein